MRTVAYGRSEGILLLRVLDLLSCSPLESLACDPMPASMPYPHGEEWKTLVYALGVSLEVGPPTPVKPDDCAPADILVAVS